MKKSDLTKQAKLIKLSLRRHCPEILTTLGVVGMVGTTVLAVRATPKAILLKEGLEEKEEAPTKIEVFKTLAPVYLPSAALGVTSILLIFTANSVHIKRSAALATAYKISETAFSDYKSKVIETIGKKKEESVIDQIAKDRLDRDPVSEEKITKTNNGELLCYDAMFGRYFRSDMEAIRKSVNDLNAIMIKDDYVSLNDFHDAIGLEPTEVGDLLGWHVDLGLLDVRFSSRIAFNGEPCLVIMYDIAPGYDYAYM